MREKNTAIKCLEKQTINVNHDDVKHRYIVFLAAVITGNLELVKRFYVNDESTIRHSIAYERSTLQLATIFGKGSIAFYLLDKGRDYNQIDKYGNNIPLLASFYGNLEVVKELHKSKASFYHINYRGYSAYLLAAKKDHLNVLKYLHIMKLGHSQALHVNETAFLLAVENGCLKTVKYLLNLKHGVTLDSVNKYGDISLLRIFNNNMDDEESCLRIETFDSYLSSGDDFLENFSEKELASFRQKYQRGLFCYVEIDELRKYKFSALGVAALYGHLNIVEHLCKKAYNYGQWQNDVNDAFLLAVIGREVAVIECLLKNGAQLEHTDHAGNTALSLAIREENLEIVKYLHGKGATSSHKNLQGETAIDQTKKQGRKDIISYFEKQEVLHPVDHLRKNNSGPEVLGSYHSHASSNDSNLPSESRQRFADQYSLPNIASRTSSPIYSARLPHDDEKKEISNTCSPFVLT